MNWLLNLIRDLGKKKFTGNLRINFFKGGVTNVNKDESIKPPKEQVEK